MTKKDIKFCKEVYDRMVEGSYEPYKLDKAYRIITGDKSICNVTTKRLAVYNYFQYHHKDTVDSKEKVVLESEKTEKKKRVYNRKKVNENKDV